MKPETMMSAKLSDCHCGVRIGIGAALSERYLFMIEYKAETSQLIVSDFDTLDSRMSGRGKGGKGLGKGGAKRHRKVLRDNIQVLHNHLVDEQFV